jgi:anti-anti-sigma factor
MTDVPYVDPAGVGVLVGVYITHQKEGRSLALVGVNSRVRTTLAITHVESFFRSFDSLSEAESAAAAGK